jgi:hypothetical protein
MQPNLDVQEPPLKRKKSFWTEPDIHEWQEFRAAINANSNISQKQKLGLHFSHSQFYVWNMLEFEDHVTLPGRIIKLTTTFLIILTTLLIMAATEKTFLISDYPVQWFFFSIEYIAIVYFMVEFALRFWSCICSASFVGKFF